MLLEDCSDLINKTFPDDWFSKLDFSDTKHQQASNLEIAKTITTFSSSFFEKMNLSILSGEYINLDKYCTVVEQIISSLQRIPDSIEIKNDTGSLTQIYNNDIYNALIIPSKRATDELLYFVDRLRRKMRKGVNDKLLFFALNRQVANFEFPLSRFSFDIPNLVNIFHINIRLAYIDHNLSLNNSLLQELLIYERQLKEIKTVTVSYFSVIADKCKYLIKKIISRFQEDSQNYLYAFDYQDKELSPNDFNTEYYLDFDNLMDVNELSFYAHKPFLRKLISSIFEKKSQSQKLSFRDYHTIIKHYKDDNRNLEQLNNLLAEFEEEFSASQIDKKNDFDKKAFQITYNYMLNNQLSLMVEQNQSYELIDEQLRKITSIQIKTEIYNYFPYLKYCTYIQSLLEKEFNSDNPHRETIVKYLDAIDSSLIKAFKNFEWCLDRNFLAYQPPYNECLIHNDKFNIDLFLSSSFILPINYEKVKKDLNALELSKNKFKTLFEVLLHINNQKNEIIIMKEQIEHNDRKQIEILSIFAAIVLFVMSNIQILTRENVSLENALHFMLIFAYCLGLFVIMIWLVTRNYKVRPSPVHWVIIGLFLVITYFAFASLTKWFPFNFF